MHNRKGDFLRPKPLEILALLPIGGVVGTLLGVTVNAINAWINPYVRFNSISRPNAVMWMTTQFSLDWWIRVIKRELFVGLIWGMCLSVALIIGIALISKLRCPFRLGFAIQNQVIGFVCLFWFVGGLNGILSVYLWPQIYDVYLQLPPEKDKILGFAWVNGSRYGILGGVILSVIGVLFRFAAKWKQIEKQSPN